MSNYSTHNETNREMDTDIKIGTQPPPSLHLKMGTLEHRLLVCHQPAVTSHCSVPFLVQSCLGMMRHGHVHAHMHTQGRRRLPSQPTCSIDATAMIASELFAVRACCGHMSDSKGT